jgi:hypothetical protein
MHRSDRLRRTETEAAKGRRDRRERRARGLSVLLDLAERYGTPAAAGEADDATYYERLETGARWLASRTVSPAERDEHLRMANRYARLRLEAVGGRR